MGQHRTNPTAQAAKRGDISKADRVRPASVGSRFGGPITDSRYVQTAKGNLRRRFPKVKGKARVKAAKKARQLMRATARLKSAA